MARGRMIDKRIGKSKKLAKLKHDMSRVLYFMILPHLDCEGRYSGDPEDIKEDCCPKLRYSIRRIAESIIELANVGLLTLYENGETPYIEYTKYDSFQILRKDRESPSSIPSPQETLENSGRTPALYLRLNLSLRKEGKKEEIYFDFKERQFFNIKDEDFLGWRDAYPACDVDSEIRKMREWLLANPEKKKKNYRRFIVNWLIRTQDKGGSRKEYKTSQVGKSYLKKPEFLSMELLNKVYQIIDNKGEDKGRFYDKAKSVFPKIKVLWEKSDQKPETFIRLVDKYKPPM